MIDESLLREHSEEIVTITDVRLAGHCPSGAKKWFEGHGFNFREFLYHGTTVGILLDTGDGLAHQVVARTLQRKGLIDG